MKYLAIIGICLSLAACNCDFNGSVGVADDDNGNVSFSVSGNSCSNPFTGLPAGIGFM